MNASKRYENQKYFWEYAGSIGYGKAIFSNRPIEKHIITKQWQAAIHVAEYLGLDKNSKVIELGCGDESFSENILSQHFRHIDAYDISRSAIDRARTRSKNVHSLKNFETFAEFNFFLNKLCSTYVLGFKSEDN